MSLRIGIRPLMVCSALFVMTQIAAAQTKVAVINLQQAVLESAEIKKADLDMQAKYKPRQTEIDKTNTEYNNLVQQFQKGQNTMSEMAIADLQAQIQRKQRELQRLNDDLSADVERERQEILSKSSEKMSAIIRKIAEDRGFDLVVDYTTALYFKPTMDITKDATAAYDKAYPVAAAAPAPAPKPAGK